jgi:hypothetical protein
MTVIRIEYEEDLKRELKKNANPSTDAKYNIANAKESIIAFGTTRPK